MHDKVCEIELRFEIGRSRSRRAGVVASSWTDVSRFEQEEGTLNQMPGTHTRWPEGYSAAVSITLDNMGEAAELYRGSLPDDWEPGAHFSVTESLPRILDILDEFEIRATYFIEGWNTTVYPDAIQDVLRRGHEVGFHGWQHEPWRNLGRRSEEDSIARNRDAFARLGIELQGFRPPGGVLTDHTPRLLREYGFTYCSPAGGAAAIFEDLVVLPFDWRGIDAYHYSDAFGPLRQIHGDPEEPLTSARFFDEISRIVDECRRTGGYVALLFHPFLENVPDRLETMREILTWLNGITDIWCAPCHEVARWVGDHSEHFAGDPQFDLTSWTR